MIRIFSCLITIICISTCFAQKNVTTFGIQYKPIIPNRFIGTFEADFNQDQLESGIKQKLGHSFGMVIRQGLTNTISLETGISFTRRNFDINFAVPDSGLASVNDVGLIGYEIPITGLVYIRLGEQLFMNTSIGASFNYFPSDVQVFSPIRANEFFLFEGARLNRVQGALITNIGFEFRTRKSGYFYLGSTYNLPFAQLFTFALSYEYDGGEVVAIDNVQGSYLTLDLRYYFHEKPQERKPK